MKHFVVALCVVISLACAACSSANSCEEHLLSPAVGSYCGLATLNCANACADSACQQMCIDSDTNPDCGRCLKNNQLACVNAEGCQALFDLFACCREANCLDAVDEQACVAAMCGDELANSMDCQLAEVDACGDEAGWCFVGSS